MPMPPKLLDLIGALVATPSVSSFEAGLDRGNRAVIDLLATWLEDLGFRVEIQDLGTDPAKANLIATLGQGDDGLVLAGHTDTVPCDPALWQRDPFTLHEADGRLYGLGTADMKAFLALAIEAVRELRAADLKKPLVLLATADEESGMLGARRLADSGRRLGRHCIVGEPTGLKPIRQHKGIFDERIRVIGRSGHSSDPALGNSALEGMHAVIGALLAWRDELQLRHRDPAFGVPVPTLNLGHIHGGDNPNRICGECELTLDFRPLPGMAIAELRAQLRARVQAVADARGLHVEFDAIFDGLPPLATPADAHIVRLAEHLSGADAGAAAFGTEGPYYDALGCQTVILGPGDIAQAHQPDEFLTLDRLGPTVALLQRAIVRLCT
jgi:acetylornithine deacetylase